MSNSYPKTPKYATFALVANGVFLNIWWFGVTDTWAPMLLKGYTMLVPY